MSRTMEDLTGRTFGSWTVIGLDASPRLKGGDTRWLCRCACGTEAMVLRTNLTRGKSTRCVDCRIAASVKPKCPKVYGKRVKIVGAAHHRWKGDEIVYSSAHKRVVAARGPAGDQACVDCAAPARDWSREEVDCDTRKIEAGKGPFCTHSEHYSPRCRDCHNRLDHP